MNETQASRTGVLRGIRVLDLTDVVAGPMASLYLAMLGAEVIKLENPKRGGDVTRSGHIRKNDCSVRFCTLNHNKKSIGIDLSTAEGKDLFLKLVACSDIVIENFRNGVMDRLGLGFETMKQANPRIVYGNISGFGSTGPYKDRPAYDAIAQALSGIAMLTGEENGPPTKVGTSIGDVIAGLNLTIGVLAALQEAQRTGEGQHVEVALVDALIASMLTDNDAYLFNGTLPRRMGNTYRGWSPYGIYPAADGYYALGIGTEAFYKTLVCDVLQHPELLEDERCRSHNTRIQNREVTEDLLNEWAGTRTVKEVCALLDQAGIPNAPVNSVQELARDPHFTQSRNMFPTYIQPELGRLQITNLPLRFPERGEVAPEPAPTLGQQTQEILSGLLHMTDEQIRDLNRRGILTMQTHDTPAGGIT